MSRLSGLKLRTRLITLVAVFLGGVGLFGLYAFKSLEAVKVNGPIYARIVQSKDLVADILPPPEFIVESYLNTLQMLAAAEAGADRSAMEALIDRAKELRVEYEGRHAFWVKGLPEGQLKSTLATSSYELAMEFYRTRDKD